MLADWPDEITQPLWNLAEDVVDEEVKQLKTEMEVLQEKAGKLGFKDLDVFAAYYGFTTIQEIRRHLNP